MKQGKRRSRARLFLRRAVLVAAAAVVLAAAGAAAWGVAVEAGAQLPPLSAVMTRIGSALNAQSSQGSAPAAPESDTVASLRAQIPQEPRLQKIVDNCSQYPEALLSQLAKNLDMTDFVLGYPEKKGQVFADTIEELTPGEVPLLLQYDPRWGYASYGDNCLAVTGCGPTCLSMVASALTGDASLTPAAVAAAADSGGYYVLGSGTSWDLFSQGCTAFGVTSRELPLDRGAMENSLAAGEPIVCSMGPGDFTTAGHFIVITGVREDGFTVCDPNSRTRSGQLWSYDRLAPQIRNLWAFSKA